MKCLLIAAITTMVALATTGQSPTMAHGVEAISVTSYANDGCGGNASTMPVVPDECYSNYSWSNVSHTSFAMTATYASTDCTNAAQRTSIQCGACLPTEGGQWSRYWCLSGTNDGQGNIQQGSVKVEVNCNADCSICAKGFETFWEGQCNHYSDGTSTELVQVASQVPSVEQRDCLSGSVVVAQCGSCYTDLIIDCTDGTSTKDVPMNGTDVAIIASIVIVLGVLAFIAAFWVLVGRRLWRSRADRLAGEQHRGEAENPLHQGNNYGATKL